MTADPSEPASLEARAATAFDPLRLDVQLCFALYTAANLTTRLYRPLLEPLGLTYPQYIAMMALWEQAPQTVGALGRKLHLDSGTLTPLCKRLEKAGLISRKRDAEDERRVLIDLTQAGRALRAEALKVPMAVFCKMPVAPERAGELKILLSELVDGLAAAAED